MASVVVGISRPREAVVGNFIPFFACDLARFATDADCRVCEETDFYVILHKRVPALVRALCALADHKTWCGRDAGPSATCVPQFWRTRRTRPTTPSALILFLPSRDRRRA